MNRLGRLLITAVAPAFMALAADAADWADREILGFSRDGAYFAFEEFGVQDGSGFPYSNVFVIDTGRDAWVEGTPVRVLVEDETVPLATARAQARRDAEAVIDSLGILPRAEYRVVVSNPPSEMSADPHAVRFLSDFFANLTDRVWSLELTPLPMAEGANCANLGPVAGFRLDLTDPQGTARTLHEDAAIPASRFCPRDYAITDVLIYRPPEGDPVMVVLLNVIRQGFEGLDRRYLAVSTSFEDR